MMVVNLADWPRFFDGTVVGLVVSLAIDRAILTGADVAIGFFRLSL